MFGSVSCMAPCTFVASTTESRRPLQRLADDLLRLAARVDVGGVDEVDPRVERVVDDADRLVVVGVAPGPEHHRAEAERADADARAAELALLHAETVPTGHRSAARSSHVRRRGSSRTCAASTSTLTTTTAKANATTSACTSDQVAAHRGLLQGEPAARVAEHLLEGGHAAEREAEGDGEAGQGRQQRVAARVAEHRSAAPRGPSPARNAT